MALLVAPGVCRYTVLGGYGGHVVANILDMHIDQNAASSGREDACFDQAGIILNEWDDHMMGIPHSLYYASSVNWVDLDTATGSTGSRSTSGGHSWPTFGRSGGGGAPGNVAVRIDKKTTAARGQRQGRMYLAGFSEAWTVNDQVNTLASEAMGPINGHLQDFLEGVNQDVDATPLGEWASEMVVVHTKDGEFVDYSRVTELVCNTFTSSQVRRIRR